MARGATTRGLRALSKLCCLPCARSPNHIWHIDRRRTRDGRLCNAIGALTMTYRRHRPGHRPRPPVADPRPHLLEAVLAFVRAALPAERASDRSDRLAGDRQAGAEGRRCARHHRRRHGTLARLPASGDASRARRTGSTWELTFSWPTRRTATSAASATTANASRGWRCRALHRAGGGACPSGRETGRRTSHEVRLRVTSTYAVWPAGTGQVLL
jgi:hypothetical protein